MNEKLRVLVVSHAHPTLSLGGAEIASHNLHRGLNALPNVESVYLARVGHPVPRHAASALMSLHLAEDELLFHADDYDHLFLSNGDTQAISRDLLRFARDLRPHVIHFHHVLGIGLEALYALREAFPHAAILVTFHEYLSICHNHGQMVKRPSGQLCETASPVACHGCFPDIPVSRFLKREHFTRGMLGLADAFVSPSRFLAERYAAWGIEKDKLCVIENGIAVEAVAPARALQGLTPHRNRFAYFGQMTPFKGVDVLIDAISRIPKEIWGEDSCLMIYGGNLERQPVEFQERMKKLISDAGDRVRFYGAYQNADVPRLMRSVDWVILPSVWWENSPMVIQEALLHRRPMICSDIGGLAEKVREGEDGLHFRAGSSQDLADRIVEALGDSHIWDRLRASMRQPADHLGCAREHVKLYRALLRRKLDAATTESPALLAHAL
ncbi:MULTISPECIES: glycosyltransferase family 4 protein [unclassified Rhizobium]|uniref:glycosyltransferase family 4 protein n=1 Tax=unclassified Rhizobium TaxID=2613769 RepID=UPI0006F52ED0|nr:MULTISPECIES: glycosyltransferase family 4 protein [unclassified Rhizobium]KQV34933.1 glycosyl transferase [Rhizobium sp. Root1212]KRD24738.1 glycosyl transferase [Rhizobium sp. Root268]